MERHNEFRSPAGWLRALGAGLQHAFSAGDCLEIAMIAWIEAGDADEAPFWTEVAEHMKAAKA